MYKFYIVFDTSFYESRRITPSIDQFIKRLYNFLVMFNERGHELKRYGVVFLLIRIDSVTLLRRR